jgi:hypothetical protein
MSTRLSIAMFVDACGWDVVGPRPDWLPECHHRQPVESLFGFSSACVPAILTGARPNDNDHWSSFFYAPESSPFKSLRMLRFLPSSLVDRGRVRRYLSMGIARAYGFTGYFQIYNLPFDSLPLFDYAEKYDIFRPGGINRGGSIFDDLSDNGTRYHVSNWRRSEEENIAALEQAVEAAEIEFAFLYTAKLDALMHEHTKDSPLVDDKLDWYRGHVDRILGKARQRYDEVRFALFSDHGMATIHTVVDLMPSLEGLGLTHGRDFVAVYDSTMLRFWFLSDRAEPLVRAALPDDATGRWVPEDQLKSYGTWWPDGRFGHAIYALEPGVLMNPSHMGRVAPAGMHGYRPDHEDSDAALVADFEPERDVRCITDLYHLMGDMAAWARA